MTVSHRPLAELEREVEASRTRLELAINDLNRNLSVDGLVSSLRRHVPDDLSQSADDLVARAKSNPLPLGMIGAGLAWMLLGDGGPSTRTIARNARHGAHQVADGAERMVEGARQGAEYVSDSARQGVERVSEGARQGVERVGESARAGADKVADGARSAAGRAQAAVAGPGGSQPGTPPHAVRHDIYGRPTIAASEFDDTESLGDKARGTLSDAGDAVSRRASATRQSAHEFADDARDHLRDARDQSAEFAYRARDEVVHAYKANPVVLGLGVAAIGSLIGVLLPNSRKEDEALSPYARKAREQVEDAASDTFEKAEGKAEEVIDRVSQQAEDAIGKAETEAESAIDKASEATDDAAKKAEQAISDAGKTDDGKPAAAKALGEKGSGGGKDDASARKAKEKATAS
ncbi:MAG: DUF3618 domain-containing protein [Acuticoccus sp.]